MSNTAEILNFPSVVSGIQEQRVADTDDGYTRLANELYEELIGREPDQKSGQGSSCCLPQNLWVQQEDGPHSRLTTF